MATNDFLPFAGGAGANVIDQPTYAALTAILANGFSSGTAQSAQLNKVWRQSSIAAAILAQFIVDSTGQNATDDGTTATLLANLKAAVRAQSNGLIGSMRNALAILPADNASLTFTADQIVVATALNGLNYVLSSYSKTVNLATTGAGGMDTGTAPVSGYVALYAIYNPTTGASSILAKNATSAVQTQVYSGANMPAGYTASALIGVWPTNASSQFLRGTQRDRIYQYHLQLGVNVLNSSTNQATPLALSLAAAVPPNAVTVSGTLNAGSTTASTLALAITSDGFCDQQQVALVGAQQIISVFRDLILSTAQQVYYTATSTAGTPGFNINVSRYSF